MRIRTVTNWEELKAILMEQQTIMGGFYDTWNIGAVILQNGEVEKVMFYEADTEDNTPFKELQHRGVQRMSKITKIEK